MSDYIYTDNQIVNNQDLQHWKYIRKYKSPKSGKWVYVYAKKDAHEYLKKKYRDLDSDLGELDFADYRYQHAKEHPDDIGFATSVMNQAERDALKYANGAKSTAYDIDHFLNNYRNNKLNTLTKNSKAVNFVVNLANSVIGGTELFDTTETSSYYLDKHYGNK